MQVNGMNLNFAGTLELATQQRKAWTQGLGPVAFYDTDSGELTAVKVTAWGVGDRKFSGTLPPEHPAVIVMLELGFFPRNYRESGGKKNSTKAAAATA